MGARGGSSRTKALGPQSEGAQSQEGPGLRKQSLDTNERRQKATLHAISVLLIYFPLSLYILKSAFNFFSLSILITEFNLVF